MTPKTVYAVVGDFGDTREVVPIARVLERRGHTVKYLADARAIKKATDLLKNAGVAYETRSPLPTDALDLLLIGTAATAVEAQIEWTRWGRERGIFTLWMEDLHATGSRKKTQCVAPDAMMVIDKLAEGVAKVVRPGLPIFIVGKPTFSDPREMPRLEDGPAIRAKIRAELGLTDTDFMVVVAFGGEPPQLAEEQLQICLDNLGIIFPPNCMVAWRFHPKHSNAAGMREKAMATSSAAGVRTVDTAEKDLKQLMVAADFAVATWGTTDRLAALIHGTPLATMLFPDQSEMLKESGFPDAVPVCVATDLQAGVRDAEELGQLAHNVLVSHLQGLQTGKDPARIYTKGFRGSKFVSLLEPGAVECAADVVESFLPDLPLRVYGALPPSLEMIGMTAEELQKRQGAGDPTTPEDPGCGNCGCKHG